jgi:hypothetical protein
MKKLLNWQENCSVSYDIGGSSFKKCPYCGGEKIFTKGIDDWGDNTHQIINCNLCGHSGTRKIKYSSNRWNPTSSTYYTKAQLLRFEHDTNKKVVDKFSLKFRFLKKIVFLKLEDNTYKAYLKEPFFKTSNITLLEDIKINWDKKIVTFCLKDITLFNLGFGDATALLKFLGLLNYDLEEDYNTINKELNS